MIRHELAVVLGLLMFALAAPAQPTGVIEGYVLGTGVPVGGATVLIDGYSPGFHSILETDSDGHFAATLEPQVYHLAAFHMGQGFSTRSWYLAEEDTVVLTFTLEDPVGDGLTEANVGGTAIVVPPNGMHSQPWYFADVNGDQNGDYRLSFGPSWYDAPDVDRPANGDDVTVWGGLFSYAQQPIVVVYGLLNLDWRQPGVGHGGFGGSQGFLSLVCHTLDTSGTSGLINPERIEVNGTGMFDLCGPDTITPPGVYEFWDILTQPEFPAITHHLNFGMNRPVPFDLFDTLFVVGGLVESEVDSIPWVIVYEVDGQFWREPGDTTGLAPMGGQGLNDPFIVPPSSFSLSAYPNPFNSTTEISFDVAHGGYVTLTLYDLTGREVETLASGEMTAGAHSINYSAGGLSSGIYFARLETFGRSLTQKLVMLR